MKRLAFVLWLVLLGAGLLVSPALVGAADQPSDAPAKLTRAEKERFLRKARVIRIRTLSEGITNSQRATLSDGRLTHDAHVQTVDVRKMVFQGTRGTELNFRDSYLFNVAAYRLDQILGLNMVPVSVARKVRGRSASVTWWVDDVLMTEKERYLKKIEAPDPEPWNDQVYAVRIFDQLIYNTDRNLGNLLITKDWTLWMIDHTRAFRTHKTLESRKNITGIRCDRKLLAGLRALHESILKRELRKFLSKHQIDALLARRDLIVELIDREITERGEAAVLCDLDRS